MSGRLTSQLLVSALIRRAQAVGGFGTVLHKGEAMSGAIVVQLLERGENIGFFERLTDFEGHAQLISTGPAKSSDPNVLTQYLERRTGSDPDIWFVELDVPLGEQLAAEVLCSG